MNAPLPAAQSFRVTCPGLRLLIVGPYPPPFGGIASHLVTLIPGLRARGAEDIAVVSFGTKDEEVDLDGAKLYRYNAAAHAKRLLGPANWRSALGAASALGGARLGHRRLIAEATKASLIDEVARRHRSTVASFYQSDSSLAMVPCAELWKGARRLVLTVFGEAYDNPAFFSARGPLIRKLLDIPAAVASSSKHCARAFAPLGVSRSIEPVYYGVDLDRMRAPQLREPFRREYGVGPDDAFLLFMGRFNDEMGLGRLLEVTPALLEEFGSIKLLLAGAKGPLSSAAEAVAARYPERVRVLNDVPFAIQPTLYAACDVVLAPTHDQHACMGMSIKEAMAAEKPVIGSLAGGVPEAIVDGETGYLVPLDSTKHIDAEGLRGAIAALVSDPELRARMGRAGRRRAENMFGMDVTIDRMAELFTGVQ